MIPSRERAQVRFASHRPILVSLTATLYTFEIDLADHDRQVFDSIFIRAARHPSESEDYLWTRVLAFAAEYTKGIEFSRGGVSDADEPAIVIRDVTGQLAGWIEVGLPDADRLHRAAKSAPRVAVYCHRDATQWLRRLDGARIHRAEAIACYSVPPALLDALAPRLSRRVAFSMTVVEGEWHVTFDADPHVGRLERHHLGSFE